MRIVGLARVKNEEDVIEEFVRYNLRFVDALFVVDNASFDGTGEILRALAGEGLALHILHDETVGYRQSESMTHFARDIFAQTDADFLVVLDADEFLKVDTRDRLEAILGALPPGAHGRVPCET